MASTSLAAGRACSSCGSIPPSCWTGVDDLVTALAAAAERLADSIERYDPDHWDRTGVRSGRPLSALELARGAIHGGVHHLRTFRRSLAAAFGHPVDINEDGER